MKNDDIKKDYQDFINASVESSPDIITNNLFEYIKDDLNPGHITVFLKLIIIQGFVGAVTMLFCPQFQMSLTNKYELFHYFHKTFGHYGCMLACGAIFLGSGAIFASYLLKRSELRKIKSSRFLYYTSLSGIAVLCFIFLGAKVYIDMALFWITGSMIGGILMLEINTYFRSKLA